MVDHVRAFDKTTGAYSGIIFAANLKPEDRNKFDYQCPNSACSCSFHFRQASHPHANSGKERPETFVKNQSSNHIVNCEFEGRDYTHTHEQVSYDGDLTRFRMQFPMGTAPRDINPELYLSAEKKQEARSHASKRGFKSMRELVDFIENKKHGLDSVDVKSMKLLYQGDSYDWDRLFVSSQSYSRLLSADQDDLGLLVVKPEREINPSLKGKHRFVCKTQYAQYEGRYVAVKPILVLGNRVEAHNLHRVIEGKETLLVASRIFHVASQYRQPEVIHLNIGQNEQLARISTDRYWHSIPGAHHQGTLGLR